MFGKRTLALLVALSAVYSAQAIEICHVEPRRMGAGDFNRLAHFFGNSAEFWLNLQKVYELRAAELKAGATIRRLPKLTEHLKAPHRGAQMRAA